MGGGMVAVETGTMGTSVDVSTGADAGVCGGRSGAGEKFVSSREVDRGKCFLEDAPGAGLGLGKGTRWLRERLASATFQQV